MVNKTVDDSFLTFGEYQASVLIWKVVPPILISFGTVGNILSIVVLTRTSIRTSTTALYLTFLAFSDLLVLYTGLLRQWLKFLFTNDVRHVSEAACKIHIWLVYSSLDFSAWILIAVTLERVISTWCPHSAKTKCSRKYATILLVAILFLCLGLNSHLLFGMVDKVSEDGKSIKKCSTVDENYSAFFNLTWPWIDLCVFCLIPFSVIVVGNACILFKVIQSRKKARPRVQPSVRSLHNNNQSHHNHSSMTAMLFTLNIVFLFTTSPISIYNVGYPIWLEGASQETKASLEFWWAVVNMLMYTNNSLNFLLYCLSGSRFRQEVKILFCPTRNQSSNIALNDFKRTRVRTNSQVPSHTPSMTYDRYDFNNRKPSNPLFASTDDRVHTNGFADINPISQITTVNDTNHKTTNNAITEIIREASKLTSSVLFDQESMKHPKENTNSLHRQEQIQIPKQNTNTSHRESSETSSKTNDHCLPYYSSETYRMYESVNDCEKAKNDIINTNTVLKTITVLPKSNKDDESTKNCDYVDTTESNKTPSDKLTSAKLRTINVMPSVDNEKDSNDSDSDESANDSENLTNDEESSVLSGCHGFNTNIIKEQNNVDFVNSRSESPKDDIDSAKHSLHLEVGKQTVNHENTSHLKSNYAQMTAVETTHSKESTNHMELQKINTVGQKDVMHQSTETARLDDGIDFESVSSV